MTSVRFFGVVGLIGFLLLAGCSSPLGDDDDDATATPTVETLTPGPTDSPVAAATNTPSPAEATNPVEPTATSSPASPGTPVESASSATPTSEPLPAGGAEMQIEGEPITRIFQGSETGRTMYAIAVGALWRSNDGGRGWSEAGEGDIGSLVVAINEQNILYSGDAGGCGRGFSFFDFRRSIDAGRSWEVVDENKDIEPLLAYESSDNAIVYGTNCGLSVSADGGTTWKRVADLNGEQIFVAVTERTDPMSQVLVVGATEGGTGRLFLLDTTEPARPLFTGALTQFWGDAVVDWTDGRIVIAHAHRVGVSDDGGETWTWTRDGLENTTYSIDPLFEGIPENELDPFRKFDIVRIDPTNRDRIWLGGTHGAFLSIDGGQTWDRVGEDVPITGLAISTLTDRVLISSESGTHLWALDGS
ncbi:hypothetical protein BH23CHL2_BH23CHL2_01760 [soil metagenome]